MFKLNTITIARFFFFGPYFCNHPHANFLCRGKVRGFYHACMEKVVPGILDNFQALSIGLEAEYYRNGYVQGFEFGVAFDFENGGSGRV